MSAPSVALITVCGLGLAAWTAGLRAVRQYERGVIFRFGRVRPGLRGPGLALILPFVGRLRKVTMQIITMPVPAQDGITCDNVTVRVDAVVYFRVMNAVRAAVDVQDYLSAIGQAAQTSSLRSLIGKSDLDDLLCDREHLNQGMELMIDSPPSTGASTSNGRDQGRCPARGHEAVDVQAGGSRTRTARPRDHR
jgi:regulator of protease activity HflC (stomatin/prohibitin superfamily)